MNGSSVSRLIMAAVLVGPLSAAAGELADLAGRIDRPMVGATVSIDGAVHIGRAAIELGEDSTVRELKTVDTRCGLTFRGPASFRLVIDDPFSAQIAIRNLELASDLSPTKVGDNLEVVFPVTSAVLWMWDPPGTAENDADEVGPETLSGWAVDVLEDPSFPSPAVELIEARGLEAAHAMFVLLESPRGIFLYTVDPIDTRIEELAQVVRSEHPDDPDTGRSVVEALVTQPLGRMWWDRAPRPLVATHREVEVENDTASHVTVVSRYDLLASRPAVGIWRATLEGRVASGTGKVLQNTVTSVEVDGRPADFLHRGNQLLVAFDQPPEEGATTRVEVANQGNLAVREGDGFNWLLGGWAWHPDPGLNGDMGTSIVTLKVPENLVPFASGTMVSMTTEKGFTVLKTKLDRPMHFVEVAAGTYRVSSDTRNGITCTVGSSPFGKDKAAQRLIDLFFEAEAYYSELFAVPYPFREVSIVEVDDSHLGRSPPGIIFVSSEAFDSTKGKSKRVEPRGGDRRIVREVARAWWGHLVKTDSLEEQWLSDSFAEYSAALCMSALADGPRKGRRVFDEALRQWWVAASKVEAGASVYLANYLAAGVQSDDPDRIDLLYDKGPLVIHGIRRQLARMYGVEEGDEIFVDFLRSVFTNFSFKWGSTRHLVGILNQLTDEYWQPWFELYVYGSDMPDLG